MEEVVIFYNLLTIKKHISINTQQFIKHTTKTRKHSDSRNEARVTSMTRQNSSTKNAFDPDCVTSLIKLFIILSTEFCIFIVLNEIK